MTKEIKILLGIALVVVASGGILFFSTNTTPEAPGQPLDSKSLIREHSPSVGPTDAKVTIVEFGDYQCPGCAAVEPAVEKIITEYAKTNKIRFVFRHYPLSFHKNARTSAEAAMAANAQGKFWEMHAKIYAGQTAWAENNDPKSIFISYANEIGLNIEQFDSDYSAQKNSAIIQSDYDDGVAIGINSTPTFFINGQKLTDIPSYDEFKTLIEAELAK